MTPFLLLPAGDYATALSQAARMMGNRGFDILGNAELQESEKERANGYVERVYAYFLDWLFPLQKSSWKVSLSCSPQTASSTNTV